MSILNNNRGKISKYLIILAVFLVIILSIVILFVTSDDYKAMAEMKTPKYEVATHRGAKFCSTCHAKIYKQWLGHSRHAVATTNENFHDTRILFEDNFFLRTMMGEESCYACHGLKGSTEGINCEICHGAATVDVPIMEVHEKKFKPGLKEMRRPEFCAKCHEFLPPMMAPYSDWLESEAKKEGKTCQSCHMEKVKGKAYHGFDSIVHNPGIYEGDIIIRDLAFTFPEISIVVESKIKSHGIPAGGPSRVLVLEILFYDKDGKEVYKITDTFYKKFKLTPKFMGGMPTDELIEDTQLKSLEARKMHYEVPPSVKKAQLKKALIMLRFYDVADQYQGDLEKSHWISEPLVEKELTL